MISQKMTATLSSMLLAAAAAALAGPAAAAASHPTNTEKVAKALKPAQEMLQKKQYSEALAKIHEAEGAPDKNPFDVYTIHEFACQAYIGSQNYAEAAKECEARLDDAQYMPEADKPALVKTLLALNYQLKNYDKAIDFGQRAIKAGYATEDNKNLVAQAYYLKGDYKNSLRNEEGLVDTEIKAGQTPKDQQLGLILNSCIKLEDSACQEHALERLVTYYPKQEYWENLLQRAVRGSSGNDTTTLQIFRLMSEVDVLKQPGDYNEMAQLALDAGSPGEAQRVLEKGFDKGIFADKREKDRNQRLLDQAKRTAATDQASLGKVAADADAAPTGAKSFALGLAYFGYGQYDKAVDAMQKGITKGGLRNEAEAHLMLGIAQLKAGHKEDAVKSFKSVKGDPQLEKLANLWVLHSRQA